MQVLYFAWLRERIGAGREEVDTRARTVLELVEELRGLDERHAFALSDLAAVRVAVDQKMGRLDQSIEGAREVAFFPPMTGG
jgi:molybdopterin synthase sulfur carrier subunit